MNPAADPKPRKTFGEVLTELRDEKKMSRRDLANCIGGRVADIDAFEEGERLPTPEQARKLAHTFPRWRYVAFPLWVAESQDPTRRRPPPPPPTHRGAPLTHHPFARLVAPKDEPEAVAPARSFDDALTREMAATAGVRDSKSFGRALTIARELADLEVAEAAELCGVSPTAFRRWEDDINPPVVENLDKLFDLFPVLKHAPKSSSRDIPKPIGNEGGTRPAAPPPPSPRQEIEAPAPRAREAIAPPPPAPAPIPEPTPAAPKLDVRAAIRVGRVVGKLSPSAARAVLTTLEEAQKAGVSIEDLVFALRELAAEEGS